VALVPGLIFAWIVADMLAFIPRRRLIASLLWLSTVIHQRNLVILPYPFLVSSAAFLITNIPLLSAYPIIVAFPWAVYLINSTGMWGSILALVLFALHYYCLSRIETYCLEQVSDTLPSWVIGLSVALGFEFWGIHSFIIAPLIVSVVVLVYKLLLAGGPSETSQIADPTEIPVSSSSEEWEDEPRDHVAPLRMRKCSSDNTLQTNAIGESSGAKPRRRSAGQVPRASTAYAVTHSPSTSGMEAKRLGRVFRNTFVNYMDLQRPSMRTTSPLDGTQSYPLGRVDVRHAHTMSEMHLNANS